MARGKSWADDNTAQIKFAAGGSLTMAFRGNLFDLLPNERALITELSDVVQKFNKPEPEILAEEKKWP